MKEYHKIQSVFLRDPETKYKKFLMGQYTRPEFGLLAQCLWTFTEKIDGTNIRVHWDGDRVILGGRTDNAQIPAHLVNYLQEVFSDEGLRYLQEAFDGPVTLYGEGFGAKIQGGGKYLGDKVGFCLFDVYCGGLWLTQDDVADIAGNLKLPCAPVALVSDLETAVEFCRMGFPSEWIEHGQFEAEGLVGRPMLELNDRRGERIITKIKCKDF